MPFTISLEGNISSGKSTFLNILSKKSGFLNGKKIKIIREPVDLWMKCYDGHSLFSKFSEDPKRWSYIFQQYVFMTMYLSYVESINKEYDIIIFERSVHSSKHIFFELFYEMGNIDVVEHGIYVDIFDRVCNRINIDLYVYLDVNANLCFNRLKKRNRNNENNLTVEYLEKIDSAYKKWLNGNKFIVIDGNVEFENDECIIDKWCSIISNAIDES